MNSRNLFYLSVCLLAMAIFLPACSREVEPPGGHGDVDYYTCTMHPSVKLHDPKAKCPICSMGLVPVMRRGAVANTNSQALETPQDTNAAGNLSEFTVARQQLIGITYANIERKELRSALRVFGSVTYDRQRHWDYVSRIDGYIQKLEVASRGDAVEKDQALLTIYSPDLLTTQRELLDLLNLRDDAEKSRSEAALKSANDLLESARRRLAQWNITPDQITHLEKTREATDTLTLYSPFKGVVQNLQVDQGRHVAIGEHLIDVVDLSVVWVWAQFYQDDLPLLKKELPISVTTDSSADEVFHGKIALIDPFLNEATRTVRVRMDIENADFKLRPGMYVNVLLNSEAGENLAIPVSAVLPTGERNLVFVDKSNGKLEPRYVQLGRKYGDDYLVKGGLADGERVVNSANFLIDAEAKVQGAIKSW